MSESPAVEASISVIGAAIIVSGGCYCMYLGVTHPWAMIQILGAVFAFCVASVLFVVGLFVALDKWG